MQEPHPKDKLPVFDRVRDIIASLRSAANRREWVKTEIPDSAFGYKLSVPYESGYSSDQSLKNLVGYLTVISGAIEFYQRQQIRHRAALSRGIAKEAVNIDGQIQLENDRVVVYSNHQLYPFHSVEEMIDNYRKEVKRNWEIRNGELVREFETPDNNFFSLGILLRQGFGSKFKSLCRVEFIKDGKVIELPEKSRCQINMSIVLIADICKINPISPDFWNNNDELAKLSGQKEPFQIIPPHVIQNLCVAAVGYAERNGISGRITIFDPHDIQNFGKEVERNFLGKAPG